MVRPINIALIVLPALGLIGSQVYQKHRWTEFYKNESFELLVALEKFEQENAGQDYCHRLEWSGSELQGKVAHAALGDQINQIANRLEQHGQAADRKLEVATISLNTASSAEAAFRDLDARRETQEFLLAHPDFHTSAWNQRLKTRMNRISEQMTRCSYVTIGAKAAGTIAPLQALAQERLRTLSTDGQPTSDIDHILSAYQAHQLVERLQYNLDHAEAFPKINGDARGAFPSPGTLVLFCAAQQTRPGTGYTWVNRIPGSAGLTINSASTGGDLYIRLLRKGAQVSRTLYSAYIRRGESLNLELAQGDYELRYAQGTRWHGPEYLFGPPTTFHKPETVIDVQRGYMLTLELTARIGGTISEAQLSPQDF